MASIAFGVSKSSASTFPTLVCVADNLDQTKTAKTKRSWRQRLFHHQLFHLVNFIIHQLEKNCSESDSTDIAVTEYIIYLDTVAEHIYSHMKRQKTQEKCMNLALFVSFYCSKCLSESVFTSPKEVPPLQAGTVNGPACRPVRCGRRQRWRTRQIGLHSCQHHYSQLLERLKDPQKMYSRMQNVEYLSLCRSTSLELILWHN